MLPTAAHDRFAATLGTRRGPKLSGAPRSVLAERADALRHMSARQAALLQGTTAPMSVYDRALAAVQAAGLLDELLDVRARADDALRAARVQVTVGARSCELTLAWVAEPLISADDYKALTAAWVHAGAAA